MMKKSTHKILYQILLLIVIIALGFLLYSKLSLFLSGFLGAITLYVLLKRSNEKLKQKFHFSPTIAALTLTLITLIIMSALIFVAGEMVVMKLQTFNFNGLESGLMQVKEQIFSYTGKNLMDNDYIKTIISYLTTVSSAVISGVLNTTYGFVINFFTMLFVLYFMLIKGKNMEKSIRVFLPFSDQNQQRFSQATYQMILSNAVGIPTVMLLQGGAATLGYYLFGVEDWLFFGLLTGLASIIPIVGTAIVWLPLTIYLFLKGDIWPAVGLLAYSGVVVTGVDSVGRFLLMKTLSDTHPLITLFGVILGIDIFGFWGIIFGPLLLSSFVLLLKIYKMEYLDSIEKETSDKEEIPCQDIPLNNQYNEETEIVRK